MSWLSILTPVKDWLLERLTKAAKDAPSSPAPARQDSRFLGNHNNVTTYNYNFNIVVPPSVKPDEPIDLTDIQRIAKVHLKSVLPLHDDGHAEARGNDRTDDGKTGGPGAELPPDDGLRVVQRRKTTPRPRRRKSEG